MKFYFKGAGGVTTAQIAGGTLPASFTTLAASGAFTLGADVVQLRDAANLLAQRNGVNSQATRVYNTYTDASNGEWFEASWQWVSNLLILASNANGTGAVRSIAFSAGISGGGGGVNVDANGQIRFGHAGVEDIWKFSTVGHLLAVNDNIYDIGASGATRPRDLFLGRDAVIGGRARAKTGGTTLANVGGAIFDDFTDTATTHTDGTEDDLFTHTSVASTLGTNGDKLEQIEHVEFVSSATASRRLKKYFGGTLIFDSGALTLSLGGAFDIFTTIIRESSTIVRVAVAVTSTSASSIPYSTYTRITGLTLSGTNILKTTGIASGTGAASGDVTNTLSSVCWIPAAS